MSRQAYGSGELLQGLVTVSAPVCASCPYTSITFIPQMASAWTTWGTRGSSGLGVVLRFACR